MKATMLYRSFSCTALVFLLLGCPNADIPEPVVPARITSFSLVDPPEQGAIDEEMKKIVITVDAGVDLKDCIAYFLFSGEKVQVGACIQESGHTSNNFSGDLVYSVYGKDGRAVDYLVEVNFRYHAIRQIVSDDDYIAYHDGLVAEGLDFLGTELGMPNVAHSTSSSILALSGLLESKVPVAAATHPTPSTRVLETPAKALINDVITVGGMTTKLKRLENGNIDWQDQGPNGDREFRFLLNRLSFLHDLLFDYRQTGNPVYLDCFESIIQDWIVSNPPPMSTSHPSHEPIWRQLEAANRLEVLSECYVGFVSCGALSMPTRLMLFNSILAHRKYLEKYGQNGALNWRIIQNREIIRSSYLFPTLSDSSAFKQIGVSAFESLLASSYYSDGTYLELTPIYDLVVLNSFSQVGELFPDAVPGLSNSLLKSWEYFACAVDPRGMLPLWGDTGAHDISSFIQEKSRFYDRPEWMDRISDQPALGRGPEISAFAWGGHYFFRTFNGRNSLYLGLDLGPFSSTLHGHEDRTNLILYALGYEWIVDSGLFAYSGDLASQYRSFAIGPTSHNVMVLDDLPQSREPKVATNALWQPSHEAAKLDIIQGKAAYGPDSEVQRAVTFPEGKYWIIIDRVHTRLESVSAKTYWHFAPEARASVNDAIIDVNQGSVGLRICTAGLYSGDDLSLVSGQSNPVQGWYSRDYNEIVPNTVLKGSAIARDGDIAFWLLYPTASGSPYPVKFDVVELVDEWIISIKMSEGNEKEIRIKYIDNAFYEL